MPTCRRDRCADHRPGARKPRLPSQPPLADHGLAHAARRRDRRANCPSARRARAAPPAAALIDQPHFPGRALSAQRFAA